MRWLRNLFSSRTFLTIAATVATYVVAYTIGWFVGYRLPLGMA